MKTLASFLLIVACFAGCDTYSIEEPELEPEPETCQGEIQVLAEPGNMTVYLGEAESLLTIGGDLLSFKHSLEEQLTYTGAPAAQGILDVKILANETLTLSMNPMHAGTVQVDVEAKDGCGLSKKISFNVNVVNVCLEKDRVKDDVYFPVALGRSWKYQYYHRIRGFGHPTYQTVGEMNWKITSLDPCKNGIQHFKLEETLEGVMTLPLDNPTYQDPVSSRTTRNGKLEGRHLRIAGYTDDIDLHWIYPANNVDTVAVNLDSTWYDVTIHSVGWMALMKKGTGLIHWQKGFGDKYGSESTKITLIESN